MQLPWKFPCAHLAGASCMREDFPFRAQYPLVDCCDWRSSFCRSNWANQSWRLYILARVLARLNMCDDADSANWRSAGHSQLRKGTSDSTTSLADWSLASKSRRTRNKFTGTENAGVSRDYSRCPVLSASYPRLIVTTELFPPSAWSGSYHDLSFSVPGDHLGFSIFERGLL